MDWPPVRYLTRRRVGIELQVMDDTVPAHDRKAGKCPGRNGLGVPSRNDLLTELHECLLQAGPVRLGYTRRAYQMIPRMDRPQILDVGCGEGGPTLELARLSDGEVVGVDIHQPSLARLQRRIDDAGLSNRVRVVRCSMQEMDFPGEPFDIIWSEGSIHVVGFEKALGQWSRFVKPAGFVVVHDGTRPQGKLPQELRERWQGAYQNIKTPREYIDSVATQGFVLIGHFRVPGDVWWNEYFVPLGERIRTLRKKYAGSPEACAVLDQEEVEIDLFRRYPDWYGSAFFGMQKHQARNDR